MTRYKLTPRLHRASAGAEITGFSQPALRDMKRRGYNVNDETGGWSNASPHDLAKLLLVRALRDSGLGLAESWDQANEEVVGNIVFHALGLSGAMDTSAASSELAKNPTIALKWRMDFASSRVDGKHVGGGDFFVFGPTIPANQYTSIEEAIKEANRRNDGPHLVMHVVALREISKLLVERAGELASVVPVKSH